MGEYEFSERISKFKLFRNKYRFLFPNPENWSWENLQYLDQRELSFIDLTTFASFLKRNGFPIGYFYSLIRYLYPYMRQKYTDLQLRQNLVKIIRDISNVVVYPSGVPPKRKLRMVDDVDDLIQETKRFGFDTRPVRSAGAKRRYNDDMYPFSKKYGISFLDPLTEPEVHRFFRDPPKFTSSRAEGDPPMFMSERPDVDMNEVIFPKAIKARYEVEPGVYADTVEYDPTRFVSIVDEEDEALYNRFKVSKNDSAFSLAKNDQSQKTDAMICCVCEKHFKGTFFRPGPCFMKHMNRSHVICESDWWNKFALEGADHSCPGCEKGLPLSHNELYEKGTVIELDD